MAVEAPVETTTMRAFTYEHYGTPEVLELREVEKPEPGAGEVLVRIRAASVNRFDWHMLTGLPYIARAAIGLRRPKRGRLGVDFAGTVEAVVLDFGGLKDGYHSDTTRTVHVGEPTASEREVHEIVEQAQQDAFEAVRPGVACQEVDRAARKVISDAGYGEHFIHRTGHGIGLTTHEPPYMVEGETQPLEAGMCFSIEPGIYLPGRFGVRIEDIVTVTEEGGRRLNTTPRGLQIVA